MELTFNNPEFEYMMDKIMAFQTEESTAFWSQPLFYFYPQLDKEYTDSLCFSDRKDYFKSILIEVYEKQKDLIDEKVVLYSRHWQKCRPQITDALSTAFDCDCSTIFNDMKVNGDLIIDTLDEMYHSLNIVDFMKNSYTYCIKYEAEIRAHIRFSES